MEAFRPATRNSEEERTAQITEENEILQDMIERSGLRSPLHRDKRRIACSLPSDHMSEEEVQAKNGPVEHWNLNEPMTPGKFRSMPEDLQDLYLKRLQEQIFGKAFHP